MSKYGSDFISSLRPAKYRYTPEMINKGVNTNTVHFGVMAQSIEKYLSSVSNEDFNIVQEDSDGVKMVNYNELIGPMIKTIQEMSERIEKLEALIKG